MSDIKLSSSPPLLNGKTFSQLAAEIKAALAKPAGPKPEELERCRDGVVQARVHRDRDKLIASIRDEDICRLASLHHHGDRCAIFRPPVRGSYNICYFVEFCSPAGEPGDRWVVRVPLAPTLAYGPADKLESEVAVMRFLSERTTIPVPKIYASAAGDGPEPFPCFLILEYALSQDQRETFYASLADIFIQLRRLEFPSIGRITHAPEGVRPGKRTVTVDLNLQELEGLNPSAIQDAYHDGHAVLSSADRYCAMLLDVADNAFSKGRGIVSDEEEAQDRLYHLHMFRKYAEDWFDHTLDRGPFVLVHGDLELFNLILDNDMNIISVLDWEWSRVVPLQLFHPPLWLSCTPVESLCYGFRYELYLEQFDAFQAILRRRERDRYGNEILADEWDKRKRKSGFIVAHALENWTTMDWFAHRYINLRVYGGRETLPQRITAFIGEDPARKALAERKALDWASYEAELTGLTPRPSPS